MVKSEKNNRLENNKNLSIYNKLKDLTNDGKLIWKEETDLNVFYTYLR